MSTFSTFDSTVNSFYLAFYGRPADPAGMKYWSQQLANNNGDFSAIVNAFADSQEAQTRFGSNTVAERISDIYMQLFNRVPDTDGMAYWMNAINKGQASLGDVAFAILRGARGSDATLSELRQQAADAFTAEVEASGSQYDGYASIEAARVLVRAVTPGSTQQDLDTLVKSAVSFADTATKTPMVVEAIAVNTTLLSLFDTTRGKGDPVALARALADTAKAAAGDPVTLESLLRGGGMDKVLKVMPAAATLKDVVKALADGGLPAAVEVVYPTQRESEGGAAPQPVGKLKLDFLAVTQGPGDTETDNVTNLDKPLVGFTYSGRDLRAGERFQYSLDNREWTDKGIQLVKEHAFNIVSIDGIDLREGRPITNKHVLLESDVNLDMDPHANRETTVYLRVIDANKAEVVSTSHSVVYDSYAAPLAPMFKHATFDKMLNPSGNIIVSDAAHEFFNLEPGARVQYKPIELIYGRLAPGANVTVAAGDSDGWSDQAPDIVDGYNTYQVRQIDASGNVSAPSTVAFVLDNKAPLQPEIALEADTGVSKTDGITNNGTLLINGLEKSYQTGWEYSTDGTNWKFGGVNGTSGSAQFDLAKLHTDIATTIQVRQRDAAGNVSDAAKLKFTLDVTAPENKLTFLRIVDEKPGVFQTSQQSASVIVAIDGAAGDSVEWRIKGSEKWQPAKSNGDKTFTLDFIDLSKADAIVEVRQVDAAGNGSTPIQQLIDSTYNDLPSGVESHVFAAAPEMNAFPATLKLFSNFDSIISATGTGSEDGFANKSSLALSLERGENTLVPAHNYVSELGISLNNSFVTFGTTPALDFYRLSWGNDTFLTNAQDGHGYIREGRISFVGGQASSTLVEGFTIDRSQIFDVVSDMDSPNNYGVNSAYIAAPGVTARVHTGDGMDLVVANDAAKLTIVYDQVGYSMQDVILGFDTKHDTIELGGELALKLDDSRDAKLKWATASGSKFVVDPDIEAVKIETSAPLGTAPYGDDQVNTLKTLNDALDMRQLDSAADLLILLNHGDTSTLISYMDMNGDKMVDGNEYTIIAVATQGVIEPLNIEVVGTALP